MGQLDPCHYNFLKLDFMLKYMPLSGMIFNVKPNFTELWWHESNFPYFKKSNAVTLDKKKFFWLCATTEARIFISKEKTKNIWIKKILF